MKRIVVLLTVMALMVVMLAMSVAPAFAGWETSGPSEGCRTGHLLIVVGAAHDPRAADAVNGKRSGDFFICEYLGANGTWTYYDNRPIPG